MDLYDKFKRFLGLSDRRESPNFSEQDRYWTPQPPNRSDEFHESPFHESPGRSFSVFSDPLEIHKYFEQQMSEMLRNFGFQEFGNFGFPQMEEFEEGHNFGPQIEEIPSDEEVQSGDLRNQFLKPGFEKPTPGLPGERRDGDLDGKLDIKNWGSVFRGENSVTPHQRQVTPKTHFFGQSVTSKTIRNADGSLETHRTVRDNEGNEETTITRKVGDKEYTVTKRRDKSGKEEIIENLVNLDEKDVAKFFPTQPLPELEQPQRWPFFDRFFR